MEKPLGNAGVVGVKSHMVLPPRNELMEDELKQRIRDLGAVLGIRPKAVRLESKESLPAACIRRPGLLHVLALLKHDRYALVNYPKKTQSSAPSSVCLTRKTKELLWSGDTDAVYSKDFGK